MTKKIGIYGGSFNPVHIGHTKMMEYAIKELNLDELLIVPASQSPFKTKKQILNDQHRINMLELIKPLKSKLCLFETKRGGVSYTIDTLKYLKKQYPNDELFLLIGSDNLSKLDKWKDIDIIAKLAKICVLKRSKNINKINIKKYNCLLLNNPIYDYSSTEFKKGFLDSVEPKVAEYIGKNRLYAFEIVHNMLSAKRAKHCVSTAEFAANLAKKINYNAEAAYIAGLFHDIAKEWNEENSYNFIETFGLNPQDFKKYQLHQVCAYLWLKNIYKITDKDILHAVKVHTSMEFLGDTNLNTLDKIIYIADKICEGRRFEGIQKLRKLVFENFEEGFKEVVRHVYNFEKAKGTKLSPEAIKIYKTNMGDI